MSRPECRIEHIEVDGEQVPVKVRGPRGAAVTDADRQAVADFVRLLRTLPRRPGREGAG